MVTQIFQRLALQPTILAVLAVAWTEALAAAEESLRKRYRPRTIFVILGGFSSLGLALGGGLGWWLQSVGVRLPG